MSDEPRCARCNRKLKDATSLSRGMGKVCWKKHQLYLEKFCISLFPETAEKPKKKTA